MFTEGGWSGPVVRTGLSKKAVGSKQLSVAWESPGYRKNGGRAGLPTRTGTMEGRHEPSSPRAAEEPWQTMPRPAAPPEDGLGHAPERGGFGRLGHALGAEPRALLSRSVKVERKWKMAPREPCSSVSLVPWAAALLLAVGMKRVLALPEICTQCPGAVQNTSSVAAYCEKTELMQARCCLNQKGTILGLDLQNCSLKDPGPSFFQASTAVIIDLQANPLKDNLTDIFRGFTKLQTLILPQDVTCPGGINAWESIASFKDKQICQGQKDLCNITGSPEMCPENGSCAPEGPGLLQCVCADGFHGYKCMRQGSFSLLMLFGILGSTTLAISVLLWGTQRRKAKAS